MTQPQSANLITYSNDFSNAYWNKTGSSVVSGQSSPDGLTNAFKLITDNGTLLTSGFLQAEPDIIASTYTFSGFLKIEEFNRASIYVRNAAAGGDNVNAIFDLDTGTLVSLTDAGLLTGISTNITPFINGFYRCSVTFSSSSIMTLRARFLCSDDTETLGDGTSGIYI